MFSAYIAGRRSSILRWSRVPGLRRKIACSWSVSSSTEPKLGAKLQLIYQAELASSAVKGKDPRQFQFSIALDLNFDFRAHLSNQLLLEIFFICPFTSTFCPILNERFFSFSNKIPQIESQRICNDKTVALMTHNLCQSVNAPVSICLLDGTIILIQTLRRLNGQPRRISESLSFMKSMVIGGAKSLSTCLVERTTTLKTTTTLRSSAVSSSEIGSRKWS